MVKKIISLILTGGIICNSITMVNAKTLPLEYTSNLSLIDLVMYSMSLTELDEIVLVDSILCGNSPYKSEQKNCGFVCRDSVRVLELLHDFEKDPETAKLTPMEVLIQVLLRNRKLFYSVAMKLVRAVSLMKLKRIPSRLYGEAYKRF